MKVRALAALSACLLIAVVIAGCGGGGSSTAGSTSGGDESSASGPAPSKAVFIKEADGICKATMDGFEGEVQSYAEEHGMSSGEAPSTEQQVEIYEEVLLPAFVSQVDELEALTPPEGDEDTVGEIIDALHSGIEDAEGDPEQLVEGKNPFSDASAKASAYGLKVCGAE